MQYLFLYNSKRQHYNTKHSKKNWSILNETAAPKITGMLLMLVHNTHNDSLQADAG
jgi:hypothetical protein